VLHTGACWVLLTLRDAIPEPQALASAEFKTLRLIKVAAHIIETATGVRIAFAASCPAAHLFGGIARWLQPAGPWSTGPMPPMRPDQPGNPKACRSLHQIAMEYRGRAAPARQTVSAPSRTANKAG